MQHEQSFADSFNAFMRKKARAHGCRFHSFSTDGQDRYAGADYVLTDSDRFTLVEFKYNRTDLVSEKHKPRRLKLCNLLSTRHDMLKLHDQCHFISWTEGPSKSVKTNIYRHEICNSGVFGNNCGLSADSPCTTTRVSVGTFATDFFAPTGSRSLPMAEFTIYLAWLMTQASGSSNSTLELVAYNPTSNDLALVILNSISEAQLWVKKHYRV